MRTTKEIIQELKLLIKDKGYIYAFCMIVAEDFFINPETLHEIDHREMLSIQECAFLLGFMIQNEIDFNIPDLSNDLTRMKKATYELLKELHSSISNPFKEKLTEKINQLNTENDEYDEKHFFRDGKLLIEPIFYSSSGVYDFQYLEFLDKKYKHDNEWLVLNKKFDINEVKDIVINLKEILHQKAKKIKFVPFKHTIPELKKYYLKEHTENEWEKYIEDNLIDMELNHYNIFLVDSNSEKIDLNNICKNLLELFVINDNEIENINLNEFLNKFSIKPHNDVNSDFQNIGDYNLINSHPIINLEEKKYFIPITFLIYKAIYDSPFYWMINDPEYKDKASNNRGIVGEEISYDFLIKVFGINNTFKSVKIISNNNVCISDIDVFCVLGNKALCVQVKSKALTLLSHKGDLEQIQKDFKGAIQDAYSQGLICRKEILERRSKLIDENGNEIILKEEIDEVYLMCLTTDVMLQVEMEFLNYYICKLNRKEIPQCQKKNATHQSKKLLFSEIFLRRICQSARLLKNTMFM